MINWFYYYTSFININNLDQKIRRNYKVSILISLIIKKEGAIIMDQEKVKVEGQDLGTADLKRVLGFGDLMSMACGQIIGAGIMALVGIGIAYTGRSVNLAFMIAALLTIMMAIPMVFIGGTLRP